MDIRWEPHYELVRWVGFAGAIVARLYDRVQAEALAEELTRDELIPSPGGSESGRYEVRHNRGARVSMTGLPR